jgi:uncharacterized protein YdaU (DUF1376 family)
MPEKLPALQFYPGDWRKDPGVQAVDLYCRGFWFECLMLMHESEERGVLSINGKPIPVENLARLLGETKKKTQKTIEILLEFGVAAKREDGAIFCRRMVRDEQIRADRAEAGRKGGKQNRSKPEAKPEAKAKQKGGSSTSTSTSTSTGGAQAPAVEDSGITKQELGETPPDGPGALTETDVMAWVIEFNKLAEKFPHQLTRYGQATLDRFNRQAMESRMAAGTWSEDWQAFRQALAAGRVTSTGLTVKKLLQGDVLDAVAGMMRRPRAVDVGPDNSGDPDSLSKRRRKRPKLEEPTAERPFADVDDLDLTGRLKSLMCGIHAIEKKHPDEVTDEDLSLLTQAHERVEQFRKEIEFRKERAEAARKARES